MNNMRRFLLGAIVVVSSASLAAQQPTPPVAVPERAIINFIVPVDSGTVNMLLGIVNNQVKNNVKKITIVLSSPGGDTTSAFAAYNILRNVQADITTFNAGNIDSAAMLIYCAGKHRYSFPEPARFLIHGNSLTLGSAVPLDYNFLDAQLQQIQSLNQMVIQVIAATANKDKRSKLETAVHGQIILNPEEAKDWGIVQEIRSSFMEPGAVFVSVNEPNEDKGVPKYGTHQPDITAGEFHQ